MRYLETEIIILITFDLSSANAFNLSKSILLSSSKELITCCNTYDGNLSAEIEANHRNEDN